MVYLSRAFAASACAAARMACGGLSMITITLNGRTYRVVRLGDARTVIVRVSRTQWRLAPSSIARAVLAGLRLRVVS